jgi:signal transduction histidine kinase
LLDKILKYGEQFVILLLGVYTILNYFTPTYLPQFYLENGMKIFILLIGIAFIYLALKRKNKLFNYIAAGNAMLVLFSSISLILVLVNIKATRLYQSPLFYYNTGIVFELAFFLLGLTYKNKSELIQGIKEQEALKLEAERLEFETQLAVIKAQQEERNRISADMHDDLGAGMTTIRLYSELAKAKLADNPVPEIEKISSSANELLNKMNAIIWSMSSSNDSLGNMIAYIRSYALEYFEDTGVNCKIDIPENLPNIQVIGEIRRNVFLVVKEALNNILKHAKATEVSITLTRVEDGLTLYIQDNGIGINMDALRQFGNGLKNMKKRMNDIDIELRIENNNGTLITIHRKIAAF